MQWLEKVNMVKCNFFIEWKLLSSMTGLVSNMNGLIKFFTVSILGGEKGYTVKYNPLSKGVLEG